MVEEKKSLFAYSSIDWKKQWIADGSTKMMQQMTLTLRQGSLHTKLEMDPTS